MQSVQTQRSALSGSFGRYFVRKVVPPTRASRVCMVWGATYVFSGRGYFEVALDCRTFHREVLLLSGKAEGA